MFGELNELDATVIGVSMDSLESHRVFAEKHGLNFPLLADSEGELASRYGVSTRAGFAERVTFVIGADKKIKQVLSQIPPTEHVSKAVDALKQLKSG